MLYEVITEINLKKTRRDSAILARFSSLYARAAAILLLPLIAFGGYFLTRDKFRHDGQEVVSTIYAPQGSRVAFNLPDGTTGMLNSGSYLSYGTPFTGNRDVDLRGEAWFDVRITSYNVCYTKLLRCRISRSECTPSAKPGDGP